MSDDEHRRDETNSQEVDGHARNALEAWRDSIIRQIPNKADKLIALMIYNIVRDHDAVPPPEDLAKMLGMRVEKVRRCLAELQKRGFIK